MKEFEKSLELLKKNETPSLGWSGTLVGGGASVTGNVM